MNGKPPESPPREREQTQSEEIVNALTHGVGALLATACFVVALMLCAFRHDVWGVVSVAVYGATMVSLFFFSTLYHAFRAPRAKAWLNYFDRASIFLLIAGSYTPYCLVGIRPYSAGWAWGIFGTEWLLAILGIAFGGWLADRRPGLANLLYLAMGWLVVVAAYPIWMALGFWPLFWIFVGGLAYTAGIFFYLRKDRKWMHVVWHAFVLLGTLAQFFTILFYLVLRPAPSAQGQMMERDSGEPPSSASRRLTSDAQSVPESSSSPSAA